MADTDDPDTPVGDGSLETDIAEYMIRNWSVEQRVEFALQLIGTHEKKIVLYAFRLYMLRFCDRQEQVNFYLNELGDEARAWWARKEAHQE